MNLLDLVVTISAEDKASSQIEGLSTRSVALGTAIGTTLGGLVSSGIQAAAGFVVDFGKQSLDAGMNFEQAMSQVAATMGVTSADIQDLTAFAKEMGATTAFSATEAAEALNYMALAGYDSQTSMEMLPNVLNLAAAGSMDLATASDMVTDSQTALGLSIEETNTLVDQMAQTSSKSNTSVQQLGDAILTVGGTAQNMSGGITEMNTVLGVLADNGIKGSEAGTHLRNIILSLSAPTDKAAATLQSLGVSATDAEGNLRPIPEVMRDLNMAFDDLSQEEKTQALSTIFNKTDLSSVNALLSGAANNVEGIGQALMNTGVSFQYFDDAAIGAEEQARGMALGISEALGQTNGDIEAAAKLISEDFGLSWEDSMKLVQAGADVISNTSDRFDELAGYIDEAQGAAEQMAQTQLDNLAGDMTLLESATEGVQIELAAGATPALREMVQVGTQGLSDMAAQLQNGDLIGGFESLGKAYADVVSTFLNHLPEFVDAGIKMIGGFVKGFAEGLPTLMPSIVQALMGIVSAIIDNIPLFISAAIEIVKGLALGLIQAIPALVQTIPQLIQSIITALSGSIATIIQAGIELFTALVQAIPPAIVAIVAVLPEIITSIITALLEAIPQLVEAGIQLFMALVEAVPLIIEAILPMVPQIVEGLANGFIEAAPQIVQAFQTMMEELPGKAQEFFEGVISNAGQFVQDMATKAGEAGEEFLNNVVEFVQQLPGKMQEFLTDIINKVGSWVSDMVNKAQQAGTEFLQNVSNEVSQLPGKFQGWISDILGNVGSWVTDMGNKANEAGREFLEAVNQKFNEVVTFFQNLPGRIIGAIGDAGRMLFSVGQNIIRGLISGITNMVGNAISAVTNALGNIVDSALSFLGIRSPSRVFARIGDFSMQGLAKGFEDGSNEAANTLEGILDDMTDNSVTIGVNGSASGAAASVSRQFVFDVTINSSQEAEEYGRKIGESLYTEFMRQDRRSIYA